MIKLVLSDLDSTLLWAGEDHIATPFALEAIHTLQDAGVHFAPATGRIYRDLDFMFAGDERACATAVTSNGQLVYLDGELVDSTPIEHGQLCALRDALDGVPDAYLVVEYGGQKVGVDVSLDFVLAHPDNFWHVQEVLPDVPNKPCFKANVRVTAPDFSRALEVRDALAQKFPALDFTCPMPGVGHLDLTPKGFGKEHGGDYLMDRLGLSPEEVCCFGDAENDLSLLSHYPNSVAVANAVPAVKEVARWHIGPANEDSVARALLDIAESTAAGRMPSFMSL